MTETANAALKQSPAPVLRPGKKTSGELAQTKRILGDAERLEWIDARWWSWLIYHRTQCYLWYRWLSALRRLLGVWQPCKLLEANSVWGRRSKIKNMKVPEPKNLLVYACRLGFKQGERCQSKIRRSGPWGIEDEGAPAARRHQHILDTPTKSLKIIHLEHFESNGVSQIQVVPLDLLRSWNYFVWKTRTCHTEIWATDPSADELIVGACHSWFGKRRPSHVVGIPVIRSSSVSFGL